MLKKVLLGNLVGLLFGATSAAAQMPIDTPQFRRIEQPTSTKIGVTTAGLALIGLELWWFLYSKNKVQKADVTAGIQELTITVDGGYEPSEVVVNAGQPVRISFFRRDPNRCLDQIRFPDFGIVQELKLDQTTSIEFTPTTPGQYTFTCGMNMFHGTLTVQSS